MIIRPKPKTINLLVVAAGVFAIIAFAVDSRLGAFLLIVATCLAAFAYGHSGRYLRLREDGIEIKRRFDSGLFLAREDIDSVEMTWVPTFHQGRQSGSEMYLGIRLRESAKEAYRKAHAKNAEHFGHHVLLSATYGMPLNEMEAILRTWLKEPSRANQ